MKSTKIFSFLSFAVLAGLGSLSFSDQSIQKTPVDKGFAVVELFTSEGCSSCPPADAVVAKIEKEMNGQPVYILAYHVDYWNRLGWKDVFSSADYSKRQNTYANWLNLSSVYTPQIVVNGKTEFVASQEGTLRKAINTGLKQPAQTDLSLDNFKVNNGSATLNYHTEAAPGQVLVLALVKKLATIAVKAGENSGRTLSHVQIVTNIQNIRVNASSGEATLKLPPDFGAKQFELIAFVQDSKTGSINAATKLAL
ncbi:DUF1223 domain-containing protein [Mucilaginibacter achroorhodeus]|uniref:DUF1223 domain-containing protein n=1 Tax=Mucilaginibacter achroorhodeus TaxID=2599294 RepID=A0A563TXY4_9SPHI|nr:DUF1223 domain-containing protein [Mucilaginibacter achroorhodeus]TWR24186.1 DUF1223 domain-containing protein [Mucilaginibacter achroorhodeus]